MSKPNLKSGDVQFHVTGASGYSAKSFITKAGGATGVLRISIVDDSLHFWAGPVFSLFGKLYDLIHEISVNRISDILVDKRKITIRFETTSRTKEFVIRSMDNQEEFLSVLEKLRHKKRASL